MKSRALSVIIPSRNREASVGELMAALGRQGGWAVPVALRGWRDGLRQGLGEIPGERGRP